MKFIHCADLHLDSKMAANLDKEKAKIRKTELLHTFERMVEYAVENEISAILIAGDMFDTKNISATTRNTVLQSINSHKEITFYCLRGNHDNDNFLAGLEEVPDNLRLFSEQWTTYEEEAGKITISGVELSNKNAGQVYVSLVPDNDKFNIVMLHGQEFEASVKDKAEIINLKALRNKGIDYLALGHVHAYKKEQLDPRAVYCYPGCLEGRGFDECGEHGFVVLDIDEDTGKYTHEFVPFAYRNLYTVTVDVTGCDTTAQIISNVQEVLKENNYDSKSLIKIILKGAMDVECEKDTDHVRAYFKEKYFFVKVYDETALKIDIEDYMLDESLKGEFVRQVMGDASIDEDDKKHIIRYGLMAIAGEEINE